MADRWPTPTLPFPGLRPAAHAEEGMTYGGGIKKTFFENNLL